jgi:hypothetical protein
LTGEAADVLKTYCIGSSTVSYFRPWSGTGKTVIEPVAGLEKMIRRSISVKVDSRENDKIEKEFFQACGNRVLEFHARRNRQTFVNPSLPHLSATPDGLLYSGADRRVGVIEIKSPNIADEDDYWVKGFKSRNLGVVLYRDVEGGQIQQDVRKGHGWLAQLYLQMVVLRVKVAALVIKVGTEWKIVEVQYDRKTAQRLVRNVTRQYFSCIQKLKHKLVTSKPLSLTRPVGRPTKRKGGRPKKDFIVGQMVTNLELDPCLSREK